MSFRYISPLLPVNPNLHKRLTLDQSAFARHVLNTQLEAVALHNPSLAGKSEIDTVFNDGGSIFSDRKCILTRIDSLG